MKPVFTTKETLSYAWKKLSENFWFFVLLTLSFIVLSAVLDRTGGSRPVDVAISLMAIIVSYFAMFTFVRFGLKIWKGEKPFWNDLFAFEPSLFGYYILASLLYTVSYGIGLVLLIIPGLVIIIRFGFFGFILVEEGVTPIPALKKSWALTRGRFWPLFGLAIILFLINLLGVLAFGIGLLVTAPLALLATIYVYGKLKSAPVVIDSVPTPASTTPAASDTSPASSVPPTPPTSQA